MKTIPVAIVVALILAAALGGCGSKTVEIDPEKTERLLQVQQNRQAVQGAMAGGAHLGPVYMVKEDKVYHLRSCETLQGLDKLPPTRGRGMADAMGYKPCELCFGAPKDE